MFDRAEVSLFSRVCQDMMATTHVTASLLVGGCYCRVLQGITISMDRADGEHYY